MTKEHIEWLAERNDWGEKGRLLKWIQNGNSEGRHVVKKSERNITRRAFKKAHPESCDRFIIDFVHDLYNNEERWLK